MSSDLAPQILLQVVLILLNAVFASAEIAIISVNDIMLRKKAEEGDRKANRLLDLTGEPTKFLATIQVGITLAGFLGSAFAGSSFATRLAALLISTGVPLSPESLETISLVVITLVLSYFTLIFGELVPKRFAMKNAEKMAMFYVDFIYFISKISAPVVAFLNLSTNAVLRLFGINPHDAEEQVTEEEIRAMVSAGSAGGTIDPEERKMIENVFEFNNQPVIEIMVHRSEVDLLWMDESLDDWEKSFVNSNHSLLPVCREDIDDIIGTLSIKHYYAARREGVTDIEGMLPYIVKPCFIPEYVTVNILFQTMQAQKAHFMFVLDEYGGVSGIVTINDVLEEIVGDFDVDEEDDPDIIELEQNCWRIRGITPLDDVSEVVGTDLTGEEFATLNGLIVDHLHGIPDADEALPDITIQNVRIKVLEIGTRRVEWALVERLPSEEDQNNADMLELV